MFFFADKKIVSAAKNKSTYHTAIFFSLFRLTAPAGCHFLCSSAVFTGSRASCFHAYRSPNIKTRRLSDRQPPRAHIYIPSSMRNACSYSDCRGYYRKPKNRLRCSFGIREAFGLPVKRDGFACLLSSAGLPVLCLPEPCSARSRPAFHAYSVCSHDFILYHDRQCAFLS